MQGCFCMPFETCTASSFGGNPSVSHVSRPPFKIEPCRSAEVRPGCLPARGACIPVSAYRRLSHFRSPPARYKSRCRAPPPMHGLVRWVCKTWEHGGRFWGPQRSLPPSARGDTTAEQTRLCRTRRRAGIPVPARGHLRGLCPHPSIFIV